jgi:hypothetical protein
MALFIKPRVPILHHKMVWLKGRIELVRGSKVIDVSNECA